MKRQREGEVGLLTPRNSLIVRAVLSLLIFVLGSLQAWDSHAQDGGLLIVMLVSLAIVLPAVAIMLPLNPAYFLGSAVLSFVLLTLARIFSPVPLPGLHLILIPIATSFIFVGLSERGAAPR